MSELGLTASRDDDYSEWYTQLILKSEMMDYSSVSGCMVIRPYGYAIWEAIKDELDERIKSEGVENAYFPLFIPEKLLTKEADHVEGFSPEVAWVTHGGDSELGERIAVRPTSETIMYDSYSKWIRSHTDLPMKLNQWGNVVRWEFKHPTPFLRTREFLWQEGHTAFASKERAEREVETMLDHYHDVYRDLLAVPVLKGRKTERERFAGGEYSMSLEGFMPNGKAIQAATSHHLGQNFAKSFDITYQDTEGETKHVYQNSWGFSTRSIGVMIMQHSDDDGLVLPPKIAPKQTVIVPILFSDDEEENEEILETCHNVADALDVRAHVDDRDKTPGWKFNHWELKGVPLRIEIGPRDLENDSVVIVRRDTGEKESVPMAELNDTVADELDAMHDRLYEAAHDHLTSSVEKVDDYASFKRVVSHGRIAKVRWGGDSDDEARIKNETGAQSLNMPDEAVSGDCFYTSQEATTWLYFAKSY